MFTEQRGVRSTRGSRAKPSERDTAVKPKAADRRGQKLEARRKGSVTYSAKTPSSIDVVDWARRYSSLIRALLAATLLAYIRKRVLAVHRSAESVATENPLRTQLPRRWPCSSLNDFDARSRSSWLHSEIGRRTPRVAVAALVLCFADALGIAPAYASDEGLERVASDASTPLAHCSVPATHYGWSLRLDNDGFAAHSRRDRDYTAGLSFTFYDTSERRLTAPVRSLLQRLDKTTGFAQNDQCETLQRTEISDFGLVLFSPDEIGRIGRLGADRPYANLLYFSSSHYALDAEQSVMRQSTMTIGVLGTPAAEALHRGVHELLGSQDPRGYSQQISDGGELTARYSVARHSLLSMGSGRTQYDIGMALEGSVGYLTEGVIGLGLRWGRITSPWWSSVADHADYDSQPSLAIVGAPARPDLYVSTGVKLRARAYNAFLQGQFRDSDAAFSASQLQPIIREAWLGVIADVGDFRLSYTLRFQSAEIKTGAGARELRWAGLAFSKRIS